MRQLQIFLFFLLIFDVIVARNHRSEVKNDVRPYIALSTFGFNMDGRLDVKLNNFHVDNESESDLFGLTLDQTSIDQMNPYLDSHQNTCLIEEDSELQHNGPILFLIFDFKNLRLQVRCSLDWSNINIFKDPQDYLLQRGRRLSSKYSLNGLYGQRKRRDIEPTGDLDSGFEVNPGENEAIVPVVTKPTKTTQTAKIQKDMKLEPVQKAVDQANTTIPKVASSDSNLTNNVDLQMAESLDVSNESKGPLCRNLQLPITKKVVNGKNYYNVSLYMVVETLHDVGLYNLYFHACPNYRSSKPVSFTFDIIESNHGNYLSAGEMPLPALYFMMSVLFFLSGLFWVFLLKKSTHNVYKIHYIMAVLVFLKSLSLMFHSINFHFIATRGEHVEAWAILYYITHLLKGAVLFITIVLIGTGWTFIKHILSDKDKKIFMIVIPLQVLANVAEIIIDESEESDIEFRTWRNIFIFVDLLCCGSILFPIVWSIRHLHEASATDGKAAINLRKLKLFRQFYIMIVCYIYFTRIIVYLLKMTVAFQYEWLDEMFREMATYVFFVLTGYKFRPESSHPYFVVDDDEDEVEILTQSGLTEGLHRTNAKNRNATVSKNKIVDTNDEEREILLLTQEENRDFE